MCSYDCVWEFGMLTWFLSHLQLLSRLLLWEVNTCSQPPRCVEPSQGGEQEGGSESCHSAGCGSFTVLLEGLTSIRTGSTSEPLEQRQESEIKVWKWVYSWLMVHPPLRSEPLPWRDRNRQRSLFLWLNLRQTILNTINGLFWVQTQGVLYATAKIKKKNKRNWGKQLQTVTGEGEAWCRPPRDGDLRSSGGIFSTSIWWIIMGIGSDIDVPFGMSDINFDYTERNWLGFVFRANPSHWTSLDENKQTHEQQMQKNSFFLS